MATKYYDIPMEEEEVGIIENFLKDEPEADDSQIEDLLDPIKDILEKVIERSKICYTHKE